MCFLQQGVGDLRGGKDEHAVPRVCGGKVILGNPGSRGNPPKKDPGVDILCVKESRCTTVVQEVFFKKIHIFRSHSC